jgi:uncharacterized membrane protein
VNIYLLVLRLIHVVAGVVWGGGSLLMEFFIGRTIAATGESGKEFAQHLMTKLRMHVFMTIMALSTIIAGALLYWHDSNGFQSGWMKGGAGIGFTIGAIFGFIAFVSGAIFGSSTAKLAEVGGQIQGKPTDEQFSQIQSIQKRIKTSSPIHRYSMIFTLLFMATARYFVF